MGDIVRPCGCGRKHDPYCPKNPVASASAPSLGWWCVSGEALMEMLRRCAAGEDPDMVYVEEYANADHEHVPGD